MNRNDRHTKFLTGPNGLAYMILSFLGIFAPTAGTLLSKYVFPILLGEVALTVGLLYVGFRPTRPDTQPSHRRSGS